MTQLMRTAAIRVAMIFTGIIVAFFLVEGILHLLVPPSRGALFMFTSQSMRYKVMKPNYHAMIYGIPFQTNQLGYRAETNWLASKEPGEERIIVLGDSYTASAGVPFDSIYTEVAARDLARLSGNPRVRLLNLALGGYNVLQFYYTLTESGLSLSPDYVVVGVLVAEDFDRMNLYNKSRENALAGVTKEPDWVDRLYTIRALGAYVQHTYSLLIGKVRNNRTARNGSDSLDEHHINQQALLNIQSVLAQRHIPLLVILLPENHNFSKQQKMHAATGDFLRSHNIDFIDLLPFFISDGHPPFYFRLNIIDRHPNARYNQLVGNELAKALAIRLKGKSASSRGELIPSSARE